MQYFSRSYFPISSGNRIASRSSDDIQGKFLGLAAAFTTLFVSSTGVSDTAADIDELRKIVAMQQSMMRNISSSKFVVGSIQQSLLTEQEFQNLMGTDWVLLDGRSCDGTLYSKVKNISNCVLPDARGKFLRTAGKTAGGEAVPHWGLPR